MTDDLVRLYRREWVTVHVVTARDDNPVINELVTEAREIFNGVYAGRVRDDEVRYIATTAAGPFTRVALQLFLPNLKGEFVDAELARAHAEAEGYDDAQIVTRNSRADHDLRAYGVRRLEGEHHAA